MKILNSKSGKFKLSTGGIGDLITGMILLVIAFKVFAKTLPEVGTAGNEIGDTGYSLTSLFNSDNVVLLAIVGGVLLTVILAVLPGKK